MTHDEFVERLQRSVRMVSEALDDADSLIKVFADIGTSLTLESQYTDAGGVLLTLINSLGTGPTSSRAKLNKIR